MRRIDLPSPAGIAMIQTPVIARRLKAADPTMVPGPKSPASNLFPITSMHERRISGADEPSAIRVKFATVSFQIRTSKTSGSESLPVDKYNWNKNRVRRINLRFYITKK